MKSRRCAQEWSASMGFILLHKAHKDVLRNPLDKACRVFGLHVVHFSLNLLRANRSSEDSGDSEVFPDCDTALSVMLQPRHDLDLRLGSIAAMVQ